MSASRAQWSFYPPMMAIALAGLTSPTERSGATAHLAPKLKKLPRRFGRARGDFFQRRAAQPRDLLGDAPRVGRFATLPAIGRRRE